MTGDSVLETVADVIREHFACPDLEVTRDTTALDVDGWDSLSHTMLILQLEQRFGLRLPAERMFELADVGELADLIEEVRGQADGR